MIFSKHTTIVLSFLVTTLLAVTLTIPSNKAYLVACDVGQGDALLITKGTNQILIDGGPGNKVLDCLRENMPFWDRKIELVINTHPEKDHLEGLLPVVRQYRVEQLVSNSLRMDTPVFRDVVDVVRKKKIPVFSPQSGDRLAIAGLDIRILWPGSVIGDARLWQEGGALAYSTGQGILGEKTVEPNEWSIVTLVTYHNHKLLLSGDISGETESLILRKDRPFLQNVDVLKVAHHGSKFSTSAEWLAALRPKLAVISVGKNPWGHPTEETLKRLRDLDIKILRTDKEKIKILLD